MVSPPATPQTISPSEKSAETQWLPLREIIQKYSETTGNQIRISEKLQKNDKLFNQLYSVNDPSWLEDFSRIEIFNEDSGKKEILLLNKHHGQSPAGPRIKTSPTLVSQNVPHSESFAHAGNAPSLSREKLQKLTTGAPWSPLPANLYEDPEYREFFAQFGVRESKDLMDRKYVRKIRKAARRALRKR